MTDSMLALGQVWIERSKSKRRRLNPRALRFYQTVGMKQSKLYCENAYLLLGETIKQSNTTNCTLKNSNMKPNYAIDYSLQAYYSLNDSSVFIYFHIFLLISQIFKRSNTSLNSLAPDLKMKFFSNEKFLERFIRISYDPKSCFIKINNNNIQILNSC